MEMISALLALCEGNPLAPQWILPPKGSVMHSFDAFFDVSLNKLSNKESSCQCFWHHDAHVSSLTILEKMVML